MGAQHRKAEYADASSHDAPNNHHSHETDASLLGDESGGESSSAPSSSSSAFSSLVALVKEHSSFRLLWLASCVSRMGDWATLLGSFDQIGRLTDASLAVAGVFIAICLPTMVFAPFTGPVADRFDRRRVAIVCDLLRAMTVPLFMLATSEQYLFVVYLNWFAIASFQAFFEPASSALVPVLVGEENLSTALTLWSTSYGVVTAVGAALGGFLASAFGPTGCFLFDSCSFCLSALLLSLIPAEDARRPKVALDEDMDADAADQEKAQVEGDSVELPTLRADTAAATTTLEGENYVQLDMDEDKVAAGDTSMSFSKMFRFGLAYVWAREELLFLTMFKCLGNINMGGLDVLIVRYAEKRFSLGHDSSGFALGIVFALEGLAAFTPFIFRALDPRDSKLSRRQWMRFGLGASLAGCVLLALAPHAAAYFLAVLIWAAGEAIVYVVVQTALQLGCEDFVRGRVNSFVLIFRTMSHVIGSLGVSLLLDHAGFSLTQGGLVFVGISVVNLASYVLVYYPRWMKNHQAEQDGADEEQTMASEEPTYTHTAEAEDEEEEALLAQAA